MAVDIVRFIEIERFRKKLDSLSDLSFVLELQNELIENPLKGDVIQGAGGVRKIRMRAEGHRSRKILAVQIKSCLNRW